MNAEALAFLMDRLFDAGALDVSFSPLTMKKSRPGTGVSVLGRDEKLDALRECLFRNSTTIGFREITVNRLSLDRREEELSGGDKQYLKFGEKFESRFLTQEETENRDISRTLDLGWKVLAELPRDELLRVKQEYIEKYLKPGLAD